MVLSDGRYIHIVPIVSDNNHVCYVGKNMICTSNIQMGGCFRENRTPPASGLHLSSPSRHGWPQVCSFIHSSLASSDVVSNSHYCDRAAL